MGGRRCWAAPAGRVVVFVYLDDAALLARSVRRAGRQGDGCVFLLYIERGGAGPWRNLAVFVTGARYFSAFVPINCRLFFAVFSVG